jgi:hypothetical protein
MSRNFHNFYKNKDHIKTSSVSYFCFEFIRVYLTKIVTNKPRTITKNIDPSRRNIANNQLFVQIKHLNHKLIK